MDNAVLTKQDLTEALAEFQAELRGNIKALQLDVNTLKSGMNEIKSDIKSLKVSYMNITKSYEHTQNRLEELSRK
jgi:archaellum component FlaC